VRRPPAQLLGRNVAADDNNSLAAGLHLLEPVRGESHAGRDEQDLAGTVTQDVQRRSGKGELAARHKPNCAGQRAEQLLPEVISIRLDEPDADFLAGWRRNRRRV
jgi:hypothetical protein